VRLKKEQVENLSQVLLKELKEKKLAQFKSDENKLLNRIQELITADLEAEDKLDREVYALMDQFRRQIETAQLNERELFTKIKKEMAKKKKLIL
jgi:hypothetical protein